MNAYGITETGSWLAGSTLPDLTPEDGLIGKAWGGTLAILPSEETDPAPMWKETCQPNEPGHIWVNTPALMKGYLGREDLTRQVVSGGWFSTGDIGAIDERGYLYLRGRRREEINKGGQKIYPGDVDAVVEQFEQTIDVCTFGFSDPLQGEDVGVAVVMRSSADDVLAQLYEWTRARLGAHQIPRRWYVIEEIPRSSRGKINRDEVGQFCQGLTPVPFGKLLRKPDRNE
jgi:acyl-CoA synthetase (AMP-forming)/AMP-acid ligase II